jgi:hypothetical protein
VPLNCRFQIDDFDEPWTWERPFDYIHARMLAGCITNTSQFFGQCFENTARGGWLELQDIGMLRFQDDIHRDTALYKWSERISQELRTRGRNSETSNYAEYMKTAGYVDVSVFPFVWPQNQWPKNLKLKRLGEINLVNMLEGLEGFSLALLTRANKAMSVEDIQALLAEVEADMKNTNIHCSWPM